MLYEVITAEDPMDRLVMVSGQVEPHGQRIQRPDRRRAAEERPEEGLLDACRFGPHGEPRLGEGQLFFQHHAGEFSYNFV